MSRRAAFSAQTLAVLAALAARPASWRHGYDLAGETGLKSGTLYPILVRLADREMVEACWEEGEPAGRPRRHLYRLTTDGLAAATAALAAADAVGARAAKPGRAAAPHRPTAPRRAASGRLAEEGS
jgi:PadR family transcriptional regulator PadR